MNHEIEQTDHLLREQLRQELIIGGYETGAVDASLITSFMPARLVAAIENEERIQRLWMDRAANVPESQARTTFLKLVEQRQINIDNLRHLQNARYDKDWKTPVLNN